MHQLGQLNFSRKWRQNLKIEGSVSSLFTAPRFTFTYFAHWFILIGNSCQIIRFLKNVTDLFSWSFNRNALGRFSRTTLSNFSFILKVWLPLLVDLFLCFVIIWLLFSVTSFCEKFLALGSNQLRWPCPSHLLWKLVRNPEVKAVKSNTTIWGHQGLGYLQKIKFKQIPCIFLCFASFIIDFYRVFRLKIVKSKLL